MATEMTVCRLDELPPGEMRLVEVDGSEDRRVPLPRTASSTRSRIAAPTTTARWPRASSTPAACTVECPRHGSLFDLRSGRPKTLPAFQPVETFDARVEDGEVKLEVIENFMATPEITVPPLSPKELTEQEERAQGHRLRLRRALRLPRSRDRLRLQGAEGPLRAGRPRHLRVQVRARVDARVPPQGARPLPAAPDARRGAATWARSTSTTSTTSSAPRRRTAAAGTRSPTTSRTPSTGSASPRRSASSSPASAPSTSPRSSTTR